MKDGKQGQLCLKLVQNELFQVLGIDGAGAGTGLRVHPVGAEQVAVV